jgi:hypothetical protein
MQEFSSVTASSYDAESLAPLLNERAADGWEVVSIVSAGTNIVAYLSREAEASSLAETDEAPVEETVEETVEELAVEETAAPAVDSAPLWGDTTASVPAEEPTAETPTEQPTEEPAGWAAAPESTETTEDSVESLAAQVGGDEAAAAAAATTPFLGSTEPAVEPEPVAEAPAAAEPEPVAEPAPAAEPAVPAGWYADPSGRFELRYWDGAAWTEHVSRAGQQFTDPPVA